MEESTLWPGLWTANGRTVISGPGTCTWPSERTPFSYPSIEIPMEEHQRAWTSKERTPTPESGMWLSNGETTTSEPGIWPPKERLPRFGSPMEKRLPQSQVFGPPRKDYLAWQVLEPPTEECLPWSQYLNTEWMKTCLRARHLNCWRKNTHLGRLTLQSPQVDAHSRLRCVRNVSGIKTGPPVSGVKGLGSWQCSALAYILLNPTILGEIFFGFHCSIS